MDASGREIIFVLMHVYNTCVLGIIAICNGVFNVNTRDAVSFTESPALRVD